MRIFSTTPATKEAFEELLANPGKVFEMMALDMKTIAERTLSDLLRQELTSYLGRQKYERNGKKESNHRNGSYPKKFTAKSLGELELSIPRDRKAEFSSQLVRKYERSDKALEKDICSLFLMGLSTRNIALLSKSLIGKSVSRGEVSNINKELLTGIDAWRCRDLSPLKIKYMFLDGVFFKMRVKKKITTVPMLVVVGVTTENHKIFLNIQQGDKESASTWREIFKDLKSRGLQRNEVKLGIMDGLSGLMNVFKEEFPQASVQRCQVHVARNVLAKVPRTRKQAVADKLRDIFYASSRKKSLQLFDRFAKENKNDLPSAIKCLESSLHECLSFYSFPEEEWLSLRTTNCIERVNKEFKRRTKPMEIMAGEKSAYRLLCFIAFKMELNWKAAPLHKKPSLPALQEFTQMI